MLIVNQVLGRGTWGSMVEQIEWDPFSVTAAGYERVVAVLMAVPWLNLSRAVAPSWVETERDFSFWSVEINQGVPGLAHRELVDREDALRQQAHDALDPGERSRLELAQLRVGQELMRLWNQPRSTRWSGSKFPRQPRDLTGAALGGSGSRLAGACLNWADATSADLSRSDLTNATFLHAVLRRADLSDCDLRAADVSGAVALDTAVLVDALYDDDTEFPQGFDPDAHGMLHSERARYLVPRLDEWQIPPMTVDDAP